MDFDAEGEGTARPDEVDLLLSLEGILTDSEAHEIRIRINEARTTSPAS